MEGVGPSFSDSSWRCSAWTRLPQRTDLHAEVRGVVERPDFVVEKLLFQSSPGLYVTANLYRPKTRGQAACRRSSTSAGTARSRRTASSTATRPTTSTTRAWFAANGYVCLIVDTLQLGEIPGLHHGTHREGCGGGSRRGYTPAGVEVWNAIRAIDYLDLAAGGRPEADSASPADPAAGRRRWWLGGRRRPASSAVVPVAGITDLQDHVVDGNPRRHPDGVVEGHCDCMYLINTYRWDLPDARRPGRPQALLVVNTDPDPIFPEAGVRRIFGDLQTVYDWYGDRTGSAW